MQFPRLFACACDIAKEEHSRVFDLSCVFNYCPTFVREPVRVDLLLIMDEGHELLGEGKPCLVSQGAFFLNLKC